MSAGLLAELAGQLNGQDSKEVEDSATMLCPAGRYHAVLHSSDDEITTAGGNRGIELTFELLGGSKPGKRVDHTLYTHGKDAEKTKKCLTQINLFALRLGIAQKDAAGKIQLLPGKSFDDAVGKECLVDIVVETGVNQKTGRPWEANAVKFCGIHSLDDENARKDAHLASDEAKKQVAAKKAADDLSEIEV